jgi:multiple antibiotic resistance protein
METGSIAICIPSRNFQPISLAAFGVILATLLGYSTDAQAGDSLRSSISSGRLDLGEAFTFFFLMLGPIKVLAPFVAMTERVESSFRTQLAVRATMFSCLALAVAVLIGEKILDN